MIPAGDLAYVKIVGRLAGLGRRATEDEVRDFFEPYAPFQGLAGTYVIAGRRMLLSDAPPRWAAGRMPPALGRAASFLRGSDARSGWLGTSPGRYWFVNASSASIRFSSSSLSRIQRAKSFHWPGSCQP